MVQEHFTDTLFYQIGLTAKYCKRLGQQAFESYETGISVEEYAVLDTVISGGELCQRDIAKLILKDRANTGKLLDALENKGLITRTLSVKNNRPVKLIKITDAGKEKVEIAVKKIRPHYTRIKERIANSDLAKVKDLLKELRQMLNETINIQI